MFGEYVNARKFHNMTKELTMKASLYNMFVAMQQSFSSLIVSNAGGPAIISTDMCSKYEERGAIVKVIPQYGSARNPVNIGGGYITIIETS
jgi:hypothetical protein